MSTNGKRAGKVYISGPMRGYPECNFPMFDAAKAVLEADGWGVIMSPADNDRAMGFDGLETPNCTDTPGFPFREALTADLEFIGREADAMVLLPGWSKSQGAQLELHFAELLKLRIGTFNPDTGLIRWSRTHVAA